MVKVIVNTQPGNRISINNQQRTTIRTVGVGVGTTVQPAATRLSDLLDVDATNPDDGEVLVYDGQEEKYVIKTLPNLNGGTF